MNASGQETAPRVAVPEFLPDDDNLMFDVDNAVNLEDENTACAVTHDDLQQTAALFLLTLKEKHKLTQCAVDFSMDSARRMVSMAQEKLPSDLHVDPLSGLETEYLQAKYYRDNFRLIVSAWHVIPYGS